MIVPFQCPACDATIEAEMKGLKRKVVTCSACNEQVQVPDDIEIGPGVVIGNGYKLEEKIGESSLGDMYQATKSGKQYTVEILSGETSRDQEKVTRLMQETDLVASMEHPNIVKAIEAGQDSDTYFLVTAYEPGLTLDAYIQQQGAIENEKALSIAGAIADALDYAWEEKKVLHRDIKPQNIFITEDGDAKLTGFGIAKSSEGQSLGLTGVGFTIGTPEYMSPEQIRAEEDLDFRADLYSLGIVLYEMVVGELPFQESAPILLLQKHMDEVPEPAASRNPQVTSACSALIDKMLQKDRRQRFDSWQDLIAAIDKAQQGAAPAVAAAAPAPAAAAPGAIQPQPAGGGGNNAVMLVVAGAIILVLLVVVVVLLAVK